MLYWLAALFPVVAYFLAVSASTMGEGYIVFGRTDALVLACVLIYLTAVAVLRSARAARLRLLLAAYATLLVLGVAEFAAFLVFPRPLVDQYPWPPMKVVRKANKEVSPTLSTVTFSVNLYGVRGRPVDPKEADVSILCLGGSTTECLYNTDEASWPWQMEDHLQDSARQRVVVANAGRSGHIAANHAYLLRHYDAVERFDAILVLCGVNDVGALLRDDREARLSRVEEETLFRWDRPHEAYYRRLRLWRWWEATWNVGTAAAPGRVFQDPAGAWIQAQRRQRREALAHQTLTRPPANLEAGLAAYRQDLLGIVEAAKAKGRSLAMMTQPTLWRADLPEALSRLLWEHAGSAAYSPGALAETMAAYNRVLLDVCEQTGTPCLDLAARLPKDDSVFYDDCHFHDAGCRKVSLIVSEWLSANVLR